MQTSLSQRLLESCRLANMDEAVCAFVSYDTCGSESPIRNCAPGSALFNGVISTFLNIPVGSSIEDSMALREGIRNDLNTPPLLLLTSPPHLMKTFMKATLRLFWEKLNGTTREAKLQNMWRGKVFLMDLMPNSRYHHHHNPCFHISPHFIHHHISPHITTFHHISPHITTFHSLTLHAHTQDRHRCLPRPCTRSPQKGLENWSTPHRHWWLGCCHVPHCFSPSVGQRPDQVR